MNYFARIMFGMTLVNAILLAMQDKKLTKQELQGIISLGMSGLGTELKILPDDIDFEFRDNGSVAIVFSAKLVEKLHIV